jgi:hypothetical protein
MYRYLVVIKTRRGTAEFAGTWSMYYRHVFIKGCTCILTVSLLATGKAVSPPSSTSFR